MHRLVAAFLTVLLAQPALALTLSDGSGIVGGGKARVAAVLSASRVAYEIDGKERDADRRVIAAELSYGLASRMDVFLEGGLITNSQLQDVEPDGKGYVAGAGFRVLTFQRDRTSVLFDAAYARQHEALSGTETEVAVDTFDSHVGLTLKQAFNNRVQPYAALDVLPLDGGTTKSGSSEAKIQRDSIVNVRAGCLFQVTTGLSFRPELIAGSESTASLTGGFAF